MTKINKKNQKFKKINKIYKKNLHLRGRKIIKR